jgi:hypothetical protein
MSKIVTLCPVPRLIPIVCCRRRWVFLDIDDIESNTKCRVELPFLVGISRSAQAHLNHRRVARAHCQTGLSAKRHVPELLALFAHIQIKWSALAMFRVDPPDFDFEESCILPFALGYISQCRKTIRKRC